MRIIAGSLGGRSFDSPKGHRTHPMSDKVRGALFNTLGDINGLLILDAFAGSGALSFEALSRGAAHVTAIDSDRNAQQTISENVKKLAIDSRIKVIRASASAWLSTTDNLFDIVLCDPPYNAVQVDVLESLAERCKSGGLVVVSLPPKSEISLSEQYKLISRKDYGDASLRFYKKKAA